MYPAALPLQTKSVAAKTQAQGGSEVDEARGIQSQGAWRLRKGRVSGEARSGKASLDSEAPGALADWPARKLADE